MARLPGLLKRTSKADDLALEEARQGSIARLERLLAQRAGVAMDDDSIQDDVDQDDDAKDGIAVLALGPGVAEESEHAPGPVGQVDDQVEDPDVATAFAPTAAGIPVMEPAAIDVTRRLAVRHRPSAVVIEDDWDGDPDRIVRDGTADESVAGEPEVDGTGALAQVPEPATVHAQDPGAPVGDGRPGDPAQAGDRVEEADRAGGGEPVPGRRAPAARSPRRRAAKALEAAPATAEAPAVDHRPVVPPPPPRAGARAVPIHPKRPKRQPRLAAVLAACPSCAVLLDPRPTTTKRCARCRERIVVKRVEGGVLYLTATAASALEEAQRTVKVWARLARTRDRWLAQAAAVGTASQRLERVARPMPSEGQVAAARDLYFGAAGRAFVTARRERRFAEAAGIRRAHAQALYRELGSPRPAPEEVVLLHRDAMAAELRALRNVGRDAELLTTCCEPCREDAGLIVRITDELRGARLPHPACEQGLCRCRWSPARSGGRRPARGSGR